jgi:hypothetical protein
MFNTTRRIATAAAIATAAIAASTGVASAHTLSDQDAFNNAAQAAYNDYLAAPTAVDWGVARCDRINAHDVNCAAQVVYSDRADCFFTVESYFASDLSDAITVWESPTCDR